MKKILLNLSLSAFVTFTCLMSNSSYAVESKNSKKTQNKTMKNSLEKNMEKLQLLVEEYAVQNNGNYPTSLDNLYKDATSNKPPGKYWQELLNPYNDKSGLNISVMDFNNFMTKFLDARNVKKTIDCRGMVFYEFINNYQPTELNKTKYIIYGCQKNNKLLDKVITNITPSFF